MLPIRILKTLEFIYDQLSNKNLFWILTGSASLVLQGVDIRINDDIDIITDENGAWKIDKLLVNYRVQPPNYSETDKYRSFFGIYMIDDIKVEIMGNFQYKLKNGDWSEIHSADDTDIINYQRMKLPIIPLQVEIKEYDNLCRRDKVQAIQRVLINKG